MSLNSDFKQETQENKTLVFPPNFKYYNFYQYSLHLCYEFFCHVSLIKTMASYSHIKAYDELKVRLLQYILKR